MEGMVTQEKNKKFVEILSWILIVVSALVMLRSIFALQGYYTMIAMQEITKKFNPPVGINFTLYFILSAIELLLCVILFVSASYVLKFKRLWRQVLVYGLIASIIYLIISPIINFYNFPNVNAGVGGGSAKIIMNYAKTSILIWSYTWSIIFSAFFIFVIMKLSREEIKELFN